MFIIMFKSKAGTEEIDTADTIREANQLMSEYAMAFNGCGTLWVVQK